jgi:hypothetical protein
MSAPDIHPEDLLDRAKRGSLAAPEQRLLDKHLAQCSACRFELAVAPALYGQIELRAEDDALLARAVGRAVASPWRARRTPLAAFRRAITRPAFVIAAVLAVVSIASAAAYSRRARSVSPPASVTVAVDHENRGAPTVVPFEAIEPPPAKAPPPLPAPTSSGERAILAPRTIAPPRKPVEAPREPQANCADVFRNANEVRRKNDAAEAIRLYRELHAICPGSTEEISSRVLVGRIYLDRLSDPSRALASFDSYLAAGSVGPLREEALIGRALALGKLRRASEEETAWRALLAEYPDSIYAEKAKARLTELR